MNIIKADEYEGDYACPICLELFAENDQIVLVKHFDEALMKTEKIARSRKRRHIFHLACIEEHLASDHTSDAGSNQCMCPLDRDNVSHLINIQYYDIAALNIVNFADNYYQLLDKLERKDILRISIIDHINLNYKDSNGKTLIYCVCKQDI